MTPLFHFIRICVSQSFYCANRVRLFVTFINLFNKYLRLYYVQWFIIMDYLYRSVKSVHEQYAILIPNRFVWTRKPKFVPTWYIIIINMRTRLTCRSLQIWRTNSKIVFYIFFEFVYMMTIISTLNTNRVMNKTSMCLQASNCIPYIPLTRVHCTPIIVLLVYTSVIKVSYLLTNSVYIIHTTIMCAPNSKLS